MRNLLSSAIIASALSSGGGGVTSPLVWKGFLTGPMTLATVTSSAIDIGAAAADRRVFVAVVAFATSASLTSLSIGGNAATIHASTSGASSRLMGIGSALVASGTTATIDLTLSDVGTRYAFFVWTEHGSTTTTPYDTVTPPTSLTGPAVSLPTGFDVPAGGFAIALNWHNHTTAGGETTWTQSTGTINERADLQVNGVQWASAADTLTSGTNIVMTATNAQSVLNQIVAISWAH